MPAVFRILTILPCLVFWQFPPQIPRIEAESAQRQQLHDLAFVFYMDLYRFVQKGSIQLLHFCVLKLADLNIRRRSPTQNSWHVSFHQSHVTHQVLSSDIWHHPMIAVGALAVGLVVTVALVVAFALRRLAQASLKAACNDQDLNFISRETTKPKASNFC